MMGGDSFICTVLTDSISHAVKKDPLVGIIWIIGWLLGEAHVVTGLDADHREQIEGDSNMITGSSNILTVMVCSPWMDMESLVALNTQLDSFLELNCTSVTRIYSPIIADNASWSG